MTSREIGFVTRLVEGLQNVYLAAKQVGMMRKMFIFPFSLRDDDKRIEAADPDDLPLVQVAISGGNPRTLTIVPVPLNSTLSQMVDALDMGTGVPDALRSAAKSLVAELYSDPDKCSLDELRDAANKRDIGWSYILEALPEGRVHYGKTT